MQGSVWLLCIAAWANERGLIAKILYLNGEKTTCKVTQERCFGCLGRTRARVVGHNNRIWILHDSQNKFARRGVDAFRYQVQLSKT